MVKQEVSLFVSYAHANKKAASKFLDMFKEKTSAAKLFRYNYWDDSDLNIGKQWDESIQNAIQRCDFGLLLVSPAFLSSQYVTEKELPHYLDRDGKRCFPVMLAPVDFKRHDLKGLESLQIFRLDSENFQKPRAFTECKGQRKEDFVMELFAQVYDWLEENKKDF